MDMVKVNNRLEERSRLIFTFPQPAGKTSTVRICPFFENPVVREKRSSNLVKYDILGRAGNMIGYTGAKSRQITVDFNITLEHVFHLASQNFSSPKPAPDDDEEKKKEFFEQQGEDSDKEIKQTLWGAKRAEFLTLLNDGLNPQGTPTGAGGAPAVAAPDPEDYTPDLKFASTMNGAYAKSHLYAQAVEIIVFWIGLIRSSTMNNSNNPALGPPVIRLTHGVLYNRICTVAENYSISIDEQAGYDMVSLLPRRLKITLNLLEVQKNHTQDAVEAEEVIYGWERSLDEDYLSKLVDDDNVFRGGKLWKDNYGK